MMRATLETDVIGDQCTVDGCRNRWTCDFGFGRLCSLHDRERALGASQRPLPVRMPTHAPARPFNEAAERDDEEYVHDDSDLPF